MSLLPPQSPLPLGALRILCVDDHEIISRLTGQTLARLGCMVETARDGHEGWQKFIQASFDLVITDLAMPHLDGVGPISLLRQSGKPVRIIVHSSDITPLQLTKLRALGVDATVIKGVETRTLGEVVMRVAGAKP